MTIGQLAKRARVNPQTIRYYEREGILPEPRRQAGSDYRDYAEDSLRILAFIKEAQGAGFKLAQIQKLLKADLRPEGCKDVQRLIEERLHEVKLRLRQLRSFERSLKVLLCRCRESKITMACPALSLLRDGQPESR
jgi:DNA-binding transcriptional MerR regulator